MTAVPPHVKAIAAFTWPPVTRGKRMSLLDFQDTTHRSIHAFAPPVSTCHRLSLRGCCCATLPVRRFTLLCSAQLYSGDTAPGAFSHDHTKACPYSMEEGVICQFVIREGCFRNEVQKILYIIFWTANKASTSSQFRIRNKRA